MSTKIHNAVRWDVPVCEAFAHCVALRPILLEAVTRFAGPVVAELAVAHLISERPATDRVVSSLPQFRKKLAAKFAEAAADLTWNPFDVSVWVAVLTDPSDREHLYGLFGASSGGKAVQSLFETLLAMPGAAEFQYWNNSDRPSGISAAAWSKRAATWDRCLGGNGYGTPAECGIVIDVSASDIDLYKLLVSLLPAVCARLVERPDCPYSKAELDQIAALGNPS